MVVILELMSDGQDVDDAAALNLIQCHVAR